MRNRIVLFALVVGQWFAGSVFGQEGSGADPAQSIVRYQDYLARKPYHDWGFDKLCEAAIQIHRLPALIGEYEERVKNDPTDETSRVILARLYAKNGKVGDALEQLKLVTQHDANYQLLFGAFLLKQNSFAEALAAFDSAALAATDPKQLREIHKRRGEAALATGDRPRAVAAFFALAELEPESFHTRIEAAKALADHGLSKESLEQLAVAEKLAGEDASKRCQVLSETGRLYERQNDAERAIEVYERAMPLMARGNWLKKDLEARLIAIHKRAGTLDRLIASARARVERDRQDIDSRVLVARALEEAGMREAARDELRAITKDFPDDLALSRQLLGVLAALNDLDGGIEEMQRILEKKPDELEIYIDLGRAFASAGRLEQAKLQWTKTLEKRLTDAALCARIGSLFAYHRMNDDATEMYERAIRLEPKEVRYYGDLAALFAGSERREDALAVLARAEGVVDGSPSAQEELAQQFREYGEIEKARVLIERALATKGDDSRLLTLLADLLALEGNRDRASEVLHHLIDVAPERAVQSTSVGTLLRLYQATGEVELLMAREREVLEKDPKSRSASLVLGKALVQRREPDLAIEIFERLLAADPESEIAQEQVARLLEARGDLDEALVRFQRLVSEKPANRRQFLKEIARIHLALYDQDKAFASYEEILRSSPDNPAAFVEVADAYQKLGLFEKATDCLKQAVRLKPDDARNRLKLAEALRRNRENDEALEQIEAALATKDPDILEDARRKYYALLSEIGRLDATIAQLRVRCDENPYDSESPIRLTDLYTRELEYELALELLDRLLNFQPKEIPLRRERARILRFMERWDDAISDLEVLLAEEGVDRERIQIEIAEAAIGKGDLDRAKSALASVNDTMAVARTFSKAQLLDEAQAAVAKGLERSPRDEKLLRRLAKLKLDAGDKAGSIAIREKLIAARGDTFKELLELGQAYHDLGRKEDVLAAGKKLFSLVRIEEKDEEDPDDEDDSNKLAFSTFSSWSVGASAFNQQYGDRVDQIVDYYVNKGLNKEFCDVGIAEMALQPTNMELLDRVLSQLNDQKRGKEALVLIAEARRRTLDRDRIPDGFTRRSLVTTLEDRFETAVTEDAPTAEARLAELEAKGEARSVEEEIERVAILGVLHRDEEALAAVKTASSKHQDAVDLTAYEASLLLARQSWQESIAVIERLIELKRKYPTDAEEDELAELYFASTKGQALQSFPIQIQRRVSDDHLRRLDLVCSSRIDFGISAGLGGRCSYSGAVVGLATALAKVGRSEDSVAELRRLIPQEPDALASLCAIGNRAFALDLFDFAEEMFARAQEIEARLSNDPVLGFSTRWHGYPNEALKSRARIVEKRGDALLAYDLLRRGGDAESGELVLTNAGKLEEAEKRYANELAALEIDFASASHDRKSAYRDAGVLLAGVQIQRKRFDDAIATYRRIVDALPDDVALMQQIADLEERAGRAEETIAAHRRIIAKKRELNLRPPRVDEPTGRRVAPIAIVRGNESWVWNNLRGTRSYYGQSTNQRFSLRENHAAILKIHLERKEIGKATEVMREIARDDVATYRWLADSLGEVIGDYNLGKDGLPILRLLHGQNPNDGDNAIRLAEALMAAEKDEEAQKTLSAAIAKLNSDDWYGERMRDMLDKLEERLGRKQGETIEDLKSKVAADAKNVKQRIKLARRLLSEQRFGEALAEAMEAEKLAPHLDEIRKLAMSCEQALGDDAAFEARIKKEMERAKDNSEKFRFAVMLADRAYARGELDAIDAIFERAVGHDWGGSLQYAPSSWWIEKYEFDRALKVLDAEIETMSRGNWSADEARARRAWLVATRGEPFAGTIEPYKKLVESTSLGESGGLFRSFAGSIAAIPDVATRETEFEEFIREFDPDKRDLHRLAFRFAVRDLEGAEKIVAELLSRGDVFAYLYPTLIALQRMRGDRAAALATIETIEKKKLASEQRFVFGGVGRMSELDSLASEKASLLLELGRKDEALAIWRGMFDAHDDQGRSTLANVFRAHDLVPEAIETLNGFLAERGERDYGTLTTLASYHEKLGDLDEALSVLARARVLASSQPGSRDFVFQAERKVHRKRGTLASMLEEIEKLLALDPEDRVATKHLLQLALELGDRERVARALEKLRSRTEERAWIHRAIAEEKLGNGDVRGAIDALREHVEGVTDEWRRNSEARRLAQLLVKRGEVEHAVDALTKAQQNPYGIEAKLAIGEMLREGKRYQDALLQFDQALEIEPKNRAAIVGRSRCLTQLGRRLEALEAAFTASELATNLEIWDLGVDAELLELAVKTDYLPLLEQRLAEAPDDPILNRRAGILAFYSARLDAAATHLEIAAAARKNDVIVHTILVDVELRRGRRDAAREHAMAVLDQFDRLMGLPGYENYGDYLLQQIRDKLGRIELAAGDIAAAEKAWRSTPPRRFRDPEVYRYAYYNSPIEDASFVPDVLYRHGLDQPFLKARDEFKFLVDWDPYGDERAFEVEFSLGARDKAIDSALRKAFDPAARFLQLPASNSFYFDNSENQSTKYSLLVRFARDADALESLLSRIRELRAKHDDPPVLRQVERELLAGFDRHDEVIELLKKDLEEDEFNASHRERLGVQLAEARRYDEARKELELAIGLFESSRQIGSDGQTTTVVSRVGSGASGRPKFAFAGASTGYSGTSYSYSSYGQDALGSGPAMRVRARLVAILVKLGKIDEAAAIERSLVEFESFSRWRYRDVRSTIAQYLCAMGEFAEGEKRIRAIIAESDREEAESAMLELIDPARRHGSPQDLLRICHEAMEIYDRRIAENPEDFYARLSKASLLASDLGDPKAGLALADAELRKRPWSAWAHAIRGDAFCELGDGESAVAAFQESIRQSSIDGQRTQPGFGFRYGRALALAGKKVEAEGWIRRALASDPKNPEAVEVRALLD